MIPYGALRMLLLLYAQNTSKYWHLRNIQNTVFDLAQTFRLVSCLHVYETICNKKSLIYATES